MMLGQQSKILLWMHQSKTLQVSLLSAGRDTGRNCNQSAIHMDESRGDDSDQIIPQIIPKKHSPPRKVAVLLVEVNDLTYKSGLERVPVVRAEECGPSKNLFPFPSRSQQLPISALIAPFPFFLMAPSPFTFIALKLLSHQWSFRSIYLFLLLF